MAALVGFFPKIIFRRQFMKKTVFFGLLVIILAYVFIGCDNGQGPNEPNITDPNLARIVIPLPTAPNSRIIGLEDAKNYTNYFEAFFSRTDIDPNWYHSAGATIQEGKIEVSIPAGTYDILLLAGHKPESQGPLLLASSYVENRDIVLGPVNQIAMELNTLDINIIAPNSVTVTENFMIDVVINTKNPLISFTNGIYLNIVDVYSSGFSTFNSIEGNLWKASFSITAPLSPMETTSYVTLTTTPIFDGINWLVSTNPFYGTGFPLELTSHFGRTINFISGQVMPDVEIIITWPNE
jgi:hypothetical protein